MRVMQKDQHIRRRVPFLRGRTVLYLGAPLPEEIVEEIRDRFEYAGYKLLYLPDLANALDPALMAYLFPGSGDRSSAEDMLQHIRTLAGLGEQEGYLYKKDRKTWFHPIPDEDAVKGLDAFIDFLDTPRVATESIFGSSIIRKVKEQMSEMYCDLDFDIEESCEASSNRMRQKSAVVRESSIIRQAPERDEPLNERTQRILNAWEQIEREYGITIDDLEIILGYRIHLSRLSITPAGKITLTDWNGGTEVKMDDRSKALYFFYLRHPEGIPLKEAISYKEEVLRYYLGITGREDQQAIERSIDNLLDPFGNELNIAVSRIKKAFRDIVGDRIARSYYIDGQHGQPRSIAINRDLVIWEH